MISYLNGQIKHKIVIPKKDNWLVLVVGGVGYKVYVLDSLINETQIGQDLELFIYTQVAETALDLYGFKTQEELSFFETLLTISGVGPRSALSILQKAKVEDLRSAVQSGNAEVLSTVSGIGPKTSQKIVAGLKDKLGSLETDLGEWGEGFGDALEALVGLGYTASQSQEALRKCTSTDPGDKVKEALRYLAGAK